MILDTGSRQGREVLGGFFSFILSWKRRVHEKRPQCGGRRGRHSNASNHGGM